MGHDAHFLQRLDRVTREHTDLALALYRTAITSWFDSSWSRGTYQHTPKGWPLPSTMAGLVLTSSSRAPAPS